MATNAPKSRKTHIVRIVGTNKAGDRLDHIWVDIERMDIIKGATQLPPDFQWQGFQLKLRWHDDPDGEDEFFLEGPPSRLTRILKVCDPESQDVDDPDEWVPVPIIRGMRSKGGGSEGMGQGFMDRFRVSETDDSPETARVAEVRKIVHYDTNIDDEAQAAFDADPGRTNYVVSGEFYEKDTGTKDETQFVEHEIPLFLKLKSNDEKTMGIGRQTKLRNQYLIDESEAADGETVGAGGINPPYRLDPFQNIVNVNFAPRVYVIIIVKSLLSQPSATAVSLRDDVEVLETRQGGGIFSATLLQCSAAIDDDIAVVNTSSTDQVILSWVCPRNDSVRENWFDVYVLSNADPGTLPDGPFLWATYGMFVLGANTVNWKIRYAPHLLEVESGQVDRMVQLYPTSGSKTDVFFGPGDPVNLLVRGWTPGAYRLDKKGIGLTYTVPPEWTPEEVFTQDFSTSHLGFSGLRFGVDPPLIARDVPSV